MDGWQSGQPLAEVAVAQERAVTGGLPDPGALITVDEASRPGTKQS